MFEVVLQVVKRGLEDVCQRHLQPRCHEQPACVPLCPSRYLSCVCVGQHGQPRQTAACPKLAHSLASKHGLQVHHPARHHQGGSPKLNTSDVILSTCVKHLQYNRQRPPGLKPIEANCACSIFPPLLCVPCRTSQSQSLWQRDAVGWNQSTAHGCRLAPPC